MEKKKDEKDKNDKKDKEKPKEEGKQIKLGVFEEDDYFEEILKSELSNFKK